MKQARDKPEKKFRKVKKEYKESEIYGAGEKNKAFLQETDAKKEE